MIMIIYNNKNDNDNDDKKNNDNENTKKNTKKKKAKKKRRLARSPLSVSATSSPISVKVSLGSAGLKRIAAARGACLPRVFTATAHTDCETASRSGASLAATSAGAWAAQLLQTRCASVGLPCCSALLPCPFVTQRSSSCFTNSNPKVRAVSFRWRFVVLSVSWQSRRFRFLSCEKTAAFAASLSPVSAPAGDSASRRPTHSSGSGACRQTDNASTQSKHTRTRIKMRSAVPVVVPRGTPALAIKTAAVAGHRGNPHLASGLPRPRGGAGLPELKRLLRRAEHAAGGLRVRNPPRRRTRRRRCCCNLPLLLLLLLLLLLPLLCWTAGAFRRLLLPLVLRLRLCSWLACG
eukprot:COSAG06_NODE_519_length_14752_cov_130.649840_8_plen_349_part_00